MDDTQNNMQCNSGSPQGKKCGVCPCCGGYVKEAMAMIKNPKDFFANLKTDGGYGEPLKKVIFFGIATAVLSAIAAFISVPRFYMSPAAMLFLTPLYMIIGAFAGALFILIISAICAGKTDYQANFRVMSALCALAPISAVIGFLFLISIHIGMLANILFSLYALYLNYLALVHTLKAKENRSKIVFGILAGLVVLSGIANIAAIQKMKNVPRNMADIEKQMEEMKNSIPQEQLDEMEKSMEGMPEEQKKQVQEMIDQLKKMSN